MSNPGSDEQLFASIGAELADGAERTLGGWVEARVRFLLEAYRGRAEPELMEDAAAAGREAVADIVPQLRTLLAADVDAQTTNPLSILRSAVRFPTEVLRRAGVPDVVRDRLAVDHFPDDPYDLTPGSFAEIHPDLADPGLRWGAAKAHLVLSRRRAEGKR